MKRILVLMAALAMVLGACAGSAPSAKAKPRPSTKSPHSGGQGSGS